MPEPTKIPRPFADSGDKNSIPDSSGGLGFASWQEGFPVITGTPFAQGGVAPKRADFNGIFNALSLATLWQQQGGFYAYDATTDYEVGNVVEYSGDLYKCITANGPSSAVKAPTDTTVWSKVMTAADAAALFFPKSGGTLTGNLIQRSINTDNLTLCGGIGNTGAHVYLNGKDNSTNPGYVIMYAKDTANSANFILRPDGQLSLSGNRIYPVAYEYLTQDHIRIEYENQFQILADWIAGANGASVTFPRAFSATPVVFLSVRANANANLGAYDITTTGFKLYSTASGSLNISCIAIGKGA